MKTVKSFAKTQLLGMILVALIPIVFLGGFFIYYELNSFHQEVGKIRGCQYEERKKMIKRSVDEALNFIHFKKSQQENEVRKTIQTRVYEAHALATHLHTVYADKKESKEIKEMVREALRPTRFNKGKGYFFATALDGVEQLFADRPALEGKNLLDLKDARGRYVIREMIALVKEQGEGFYNYHWSKPNVSGKDFPKISFIKYFAPFDWFIGTGAYLDELEEDIKSEALLWIEGKKFARKDYLFAGRFDGVSLAGPARGDNLIDSTDIDGIKVVRELIVLARGAGGYLSYRMPSESGQPPLAKISYVRGLKDWQWYIGAGVYVDDIEASLTHVRQEMNERVRTHFIFIVLALLVLLGGAALVSFIIWRQARNSFAVFNLFFQRAASLAIDVDADKLAYREFVQLADAANQMLAVLRRSEADRDEAEKDLAQLASAVVHTTEIIVITDVVGLIQYVNPAFEKISGYNLDEVSGKKTDFLWGDGLGKETYQNMRQAINAGSVWNGRLKNRKKDGSLLICEVTVSPIYDTYGKMSGFVVIARDVSKQLKMEGQLRQSQKMEAIGTLAGGIAHDFNNVLSAIVGFSEISLMRLPADSDVRRYLKNILTAASRATELVKQILIFSRQREVETRPVQLKLIIKEALKLLQPSLPAAIEIQKELNTDALVKADPTQMHQMFINLCTNAAHAMPDGGRLTIKLLEDDLRERAAAEKVGLSPGVYLKLQITDTGEGITVEVQERIFEPFFTTKKEGEGTGMGLAVVHGIVQSIGGVITVSSRLGSGTEFSVYLPITKIGALEKETVVAELPSGSERILFVDDEEVLVTIARGILQPLGYQLTTTSSSSEALELFLRDSKAFDLVISDLAMPEMSGLQMVEKMLTLEPELPIIICTGYCSGETEKKIHALGIRALLAKPLTLETMAKRVRQVLDDKTGTSKFVKIS